MSSPRSDLWGIWGIVGILLLLLVGGGGTLLFTQRAASAERARADAMAARDAAEMQWLAERERQRQEEGGATIPRSRDSNSSGRRGDLEDVIKDLELQNAALRDALTQELQAAAESTDLASTDAVYLSPSMRERLGLALQTLQAAGLFEGLTVEELANRDSLGFQADLSSIDFGFLADLPRLDSMNLGSSSLTPQQCAQLGLASGLENVYLWGADGLTDEHLVALAEAKSLESLSLSEARISGRALESLPTTMKSLRFEDVPLGDEDLRHLDRYPALNDLRLARMDIGDAGISNLHLPAVRRLDLKSTRVTDAGLSGLLSPMRSSLVSLDLARNSGIKGRMLEDLGSFERLEHLDLSQTRVDDEALSRFKPGRGLKRLSLKRSRVTQAGVASFRALHPGVNVNFSP